MEITKQKTKSKKAGRNKAACEKYRVRNRREYNKGNRLVRYIRRHPNDLPALKALRRISKTVTGFGRYLTEFEAVR